MPKKVPYPLFERFPDGRKLFSVFCDEIAEINRSEIAEEADVTPQYVGNIIHGVRRSRIINEIYERELKKKKETIISKLENMIEFTKKL